MTETYHSISEYIEAHNRWKHAPAIITPQGMKVKVKGNLYSKAEFDAANPKPVYAPLPKRGLDGSYIGTPVITKKSK